MSKFCSNCGARLAEHSAFCASCGTKVQPVENITPTQNPVYYNPPTQTVTPIKKKKIGEVLIVIFGVILTIIIIATFVNPDNDDTKTNTSSTKTKTTQASKKDDALANQNKVKISLKGIKSKSALFGVGEGLELLVENSRSENIIITVSEVSVDGTMQTVIQPQMPLNETAAGKNSVQTIIFPEAKLEGSKVSLKIHVKNTSYGDIFVTRSLTIQL